MHPLSWMVSCAQPVAHPVGDARREAAHPRVAGGPVHAPAGHRVPLAELPEHRGNVVGVVLEIGVHHDHVPAAHRLQARVGGRGLSGVRLEPHQPRARVPLTELADDLGAPIAAAVVHEDDLVAQAGRIEHLADLRPEQREILLLVVDGHDDGEVQRGGHRLRARGGCGQLEGGPGTRGGAPCHSGASVCGSPRRSSTRASVWTTRSSICFGRW